MNILAVVFIRLLFPLSILKFPLLGGILALALDYIDFEIYKEFNHGRLDYYQDLDKVLDMFYLGIEAYVAYHFRNILVKNTALFLYFYRFLGFILFMFTQNPIVLVIFPNIFEFFYLTYLSLKKVFKKEVLTSFKSIILTITILTILKLIHEYFIHINTAIPWTENHYFKMVMNLLK